MAVKHSNCLYIFSSPICIKINFTIEKCDVCNHDFLLRLSQNRNELAKTSTVCIQIYMNESLIATLIMLTVHYS